MGADEGGGLVSADDTTTERPKCPYPGCNFGFVDDWQRPEQQVCPRCGGSGKDWGSDTSPYDAPLACVVERKP